MSKIILAKKKIARKYGVDLYGEHRSTRTKKPYLPGMHGEKLVRRVTTYSSQLKAKQILKFYYGLTEKVLKKYANIAINAKGNGIDNLANALERRLDVVIFRAGFVPTIFAAKQLVSHGHVQVDGKTVNVSSYSLKNGQVVSLKQRARKMDLVVNSVSVASSLRKIADYLDVDTAGFVTSIKQNFNATEVPYECEMEFPLIVEYYNR